MPILVSSLRFFFLAFYMEICLVLTSNYVARRCCLSVGLLLLVMALFFIGASWILFFFKSRGETASESMIFNTRSLVDAKSGIFNEIIYGLLSLLVLSVSCLWFLSYYLGILCLRWSILLKTGLDLTFCLGSTNSVSILSMVALFCFTCSSCTGSCRLRLYSKSRRLSNTFYSYVRSSFC